MQIGDVVWLPMSLTCFSYQNGKCFMKKKSFINIQLRPIYPNTFLKIDNCHDWNLFLDCLIKRISMSGFVFCWKVISMKKNPLHAKTYFFHYAMKKFIECVYYVCCHIDTNLMTKSLCWFIIWLQQLLVNTESYVKKVFFSLYFKFALL